MPKVTQKSVRSRQPWHPIKGHELDMAGAAARKEYESGKYKEWKEADRLRTEADRAASAVRTRQEIAMERVLEESGIVVPDGVSVLKVFNEHCARRRAEKR